MDQQLITRIVEAALLAANQPLTVAQLRGLLTNGELPIEEPVADGAFHRFESLFEAREGRLGVVVTFLGLLTLAKEQLVEIVQEGPLQPIYVKSLAVGEGAPESLELSSEFDDEPDAANDASA